MKVLGAMLMSETSGCLGNRNILPVTIKRDTVSAVVKHPTFCWFFMGKKSAQKEILCLKKKNFDQIYKISFQCWSNQVNPLFKCLLDFIGSELLRPSLFPPSPVPPVSAERLLWFYCLCLHFRFALWFHCAAIQEGGTGAVCSKMLVTKPLSLTLSNFSHHGPA